jgi:ribosomal protein S25
MSRKQKTLNIFSDELDELINTEINKIEELLPTDMTVQRLATSKRISEDMARRMLRRLVRDGKLVVVKARLPQSHNYVNAYRLP